MKYEKGRRGKYWQQNGFKRKPYSFVFFSSLCICNFKNIVQFFNPWLDLLFVYWLNTALIYESFSVCKYLEIFFTYWFVDCHCKWVGKNIEIQRNRISNWPLKKKIYLTVCVCWSYQTSEISYMKKGKKNGRLSSMCRPWSVWSCSEQNIWSFHKNNSRDSNCCGKSHN